MLRFAALSLALCLAPACRAGEATAPDSDSRGAVSLPPAPAPPFEVEILMAGKPPHKPLRFAPGKAGSSQVVLWRYYSKLGPNVAAYKNKSDRWTLVSEVGPGDHSGSFSGTISTVLEDVQETAPLARVEIGPRGPIGGFERLRGDEPWQLGLLDRLVTAFPEEAIGEGAIWQATAAQSGLRITYELVDIDHDTLHLRGESTALAEASPRPDAKAPPPEKGTVLQGDFELWWNTSEPIPQRGRLKERRTTYHPNGADVEVLEIVLERPGVIPTDDEPVDAGW